MSARLVDIDHDLELRDLLLSHQMFLWTVRHIVCAGEDQRPLCPLVLRFFDDADLPGAVATIMALLRTLSAGARVPMTVNVPCGVHVTADEQLLIDGLNDLACGRIENVRSNLQRILRPPACAAAALRLRDVADQLLALEALRGSQRTVAAVTRH